MRCTAIVLLLTAPLAAQVVVPASDVARVRRNFESRPGEDPLRCDVTPQVPTLNFAFRFQAGYTFEVAQAQYAGSTRGWSVLTAITPDGGETTYLLARTPLANASRVGSNFNIRGFYFLGVGRYSVESSLHDDRNRVCRKQWRVTVAPSRANRAVPLALAPNTVRRFSPIVRPGADKPAPSAPRHLSVLLNAAAFSTLRTTIRPYDRAVLAGALTSLIEQLKPASVRVVVFSLEQQREVFRTVNFSPPDLDRVADAMATLQQATVDVHVLQKPLGHVDFMVGLIAGELNASHPADTIVFLGPTSRYGNKIPEGALPAPAHAGPRFFYIRYESPRRLTAPEDIATVDLSPVGSRSGGTSSGAGAPSPPAGSAPHPLGSANSGGAGRGVHPAPPSVALPPAGQSDIITAAVDRLEGKTLTIRTPADLAKAIRKIERAR